MSFSGLRVVAFESRRAQEIAELIRRQGGDPFVAPSLREAPLADNREAFDFAERLFSGHIDMVILLTGVGTRQLNRLVATRYPETAFPARCGRSPWWLAVPSRWPRCARWALLPPWWRPSPTPGASC